MRIACTALTSAAAWAIVTAWALLVIFFFAATLITLTRPVRLAKTPLARAFAMILVRSYNGFFAAAPSKQRQ